MEWQLGDERLDSRADLCLSALERASDKNFPDVFPDASDQVGFYRFINNDRFDHSDLMSAVESESFSLTKDLVVLAIHDTTQVYVGSKSKSIEEFRAKPGRPVPGFFAHLTLLVSAEEGDREVYGPGCLSVWSRATGVKEAPRWFRHAYQVESSRIPGQTIHLMDREGDSYQILSQLEGAGFRYVVRLTHDRLIFEEDSRRLFEHMRSKEVICEREVPLSKRKQACTPKKARIYPARENRVATLCISASEVTFQRGSRTSKTLPKSLTVNVVRVFEKDPPKGEKPTEWFLVTSEPIDTNEQIEVVVDYYRKRWVIEEYFKSLKTGCRLEERLLESAEAWRKVLVMFLPVAVKLLNLRNLQGPLIKESRIFSAAEKSILKLQAKRFKISVKTIEDAKNLIARLGGYKPNHWPPGWIILARGYEKLVTMA